eukprot:Awhi_evm1s12913
MNYIKVPARFHLNEMIARQAAFKNMTPEMIATNEEKRLKKRALRKQSLAIMFEQEKRTRPLS